MGVYYLFRTSNYVSLLFTITAMQFWPAYEPPDKKQVIWRPFE